MAQVAALLERLGLADEAALAALEADSRRAVRELAVRRRRALARQAAEATRLDGLLRFENRYWGQGARLVAGVDEVGRGCLAGPVVAAAVVLAPGTRIAGLDDSKRLTPARRVRLDAEIRRVARGVGVGQVEPAQIDRLDILQAALAAMRAALRRLPRPPEVVLVDGPAVPASGLVEVPIIDGDARSLTIAAASVVAKVYRDRLMVQQAAAYPPYDFGSNKGYGSPRHLAALAAHGPCALHRLSFAPVSAAAGAQGPAANFGLQSPLAAAAPAGAQDDAADALLARLSRCPDESALEAVAAQIRQRRDSLSVEQVECLRRAYLQARARVRRAGERGEEAAARHLTVQGCRLLARRFRAGRGEVDLILADGDEIVFVEVKSTAGGSLGWPAERLDANKRARIVSAARHFLARQPVERPCRFDLAVVDLAVDPPAVQHLPDAWRP